MVLIGPKSAIHEPFEDIRKGSAKALAIGPPYFAAFGPRGSPSVRSFRC